MNFQRQLLERVAALPGVRSVGAAAYLPFSGTNNSWTIEIERRPPLPAVEWQEAGWRPVTANYFRTIGIPLVKGRDFAASDDDERAPGVAIINETAARAFWHGEELLGIRFKLEGRTYTVVGVVKDVRHSRLDGKAGPELYFPYSQLPITWRGMTVVARTESAPEQFAAVLRNLVQELDKDQPIYNVRTLEGAIAKSVLRQQFHLLLLGSFAALALVMESLLFGISATDPLTFAGVALLLTLVALLACYVPARRATRVDPLVILRHE